MAKFKYFAACYTVGMRLTRLLLRPIHPVFLVGTVCAAVLLGVLLARFFGSAWLSHWVWLLVFSGLAMGLVVAQRVWALILIVLVGVLLGYTRGNMHIKAALPASFYIGSPVVMKGRVDGDVSKSKAGDTVVHLTRVQINDKKVAGTYWIALRGVKDGQLRRSDTVELSGELKPGFGAYTASMFRAQLHKVSRETHGDIFIELRDWFSGGIRSYLPETEASLAAGYVLGENRALAPDFDEALRVVGLTHVVVASGYNLTILVRLARRLFVKISRYMAVLAGGLMAFLFVGVTGLSPSMTRAGLVVGFSLLAWYYGRKIHPLMIVLLSAALSVMVQPSYAWGDVGWLLSFTAFIGVMFLAPLLQAYFFGDKKPGIIRQIVGETLSAQLLTAPIIIALFGTFSNVAILANILVLPLVPLAMLLVFMTGAASLFLPFIGVFLALPTQWLLSYMVEVVWVLSDVSWASFEVQWSLPVALASYVLLMLVIVFLKRRTKFAFREVNIVR